MSVPWLPLQVRSAAVAPPVSSKAQCPIRAFAGRGEHVPTALATLHAEHASEHALLQQTPSTQKPLAHWPALAQADPGGSFG
jgi:hypothetical protein